MSVLTCTDSGARHGTAVPVGGAIPAVIDCTGIYSDYKYQELSFVAEGDADVQQPADTYTFPDFCLFTTNSCMYLTSRLVPVLKCVASSSSSGRSVHVGRPSKVNVMMASCSSRGQILCVLCLFRPTQQFHTVSYP